MKTTLLIAAISLSFSTLAFAGPTTEKEGVLRDGTGHTLYVFAKDEIGKSNCNSDCNKNWPAFMAKEGAQPTGDLTLVAHDGGGKQWALKGQPLYYFVGDSAVGDTKGDGLGGTWHVVRSKPATGGAASASGYTGYTY